MGVLAGRRGGLMMVTVPRALLVRAALLLGEAAG